MFEFIRTHQRLMQFVLLLIILPSFALFGLEGYTRMRGDDNAVAKVGGLTITKEEVDAAHRQQVERLRQMFGGQIDAKMFDTPEARRAVLDNLVSQKLLSAEVARSKLSVPDQALQQMIMSIPDLNGPDGKFDGERYKSLLAAQGMTPAIYEARLRQDLSLQQLTGAIQSTSITPKSLASRLADINEQERDVQEMVFKASDLVSKVKITDEMLKEYYEKNGAQFEIPEQVNAEYVVLNPAAIAAQVNVTDADIKSYYDQNRKLYTTDEQRRASHILIAVKKDAPAAEKTAAKEKAEKLLAQARKNPADFAKLAKENSQDPGSAERGGDLDFFGRGMMVKVFEDTAFQLKQQGEISPVVESEFGYHIIQLTGIKPGSVKPLDQVKAEIAAEIKKQLSAKKYTEMADVFTNTVYEQSESLKPVADKLGLKIETASGLTRNGNPAAGQSPVNSPKFLNALFSDEAIKGKRNTEAAEAAPNTLIAGRVLEHKAASKKPFDQVKAVVTEQVTKREAQVLARKAGEEKLAALREKPEASGFGEAKTVSRSKNTSLRGEAAAVVMKADVSKLPALVGAELPGEGYGVYRIVKVAQPVKPDVAKRESQKQQLDGAMAQEEMTAYIDSLKRKAEVKILNPALAGTPAPATK